jgi:hypothetical protein
VEGDPPPHIFANARHQHPQVVILSAHLHGEDTHSFW